MQTLKQIMENLLTDKTLYEKVEAEYIDMCKARLEHEPKITVREIVEEFLSVEAVPGEGQFVICPRLLIWENKSADSVNIICDSRMINPNRFKEPFASDSEKSEAYAGVAYELTHWEELQNVLVDIPSSSDSFCEKMIPQFLISIIWELTFEGSTAKTHHENVENTWSDIKSSIEEYEAHPEKAKKFDFDEFRKEFGIERDPYNEDYDDIMLDIQREFTNTLDKRNERLVDFAIKTYREEYLG